MPIEFHRYRANLDDDIGNPDWHDRRWQHIDARVAALEDQQDQVATATATLIQLGLSKIDQTIGPVIEDFQETLASVPSLFSSTSVTSLTIGSGGKTLVIPDPDRQTFVPTEWVILKDAADAENWMIGRVLTFNRTNGALAIDVEDTSGSGTIADWTVAATAKRGSPGATGAAGSPGLVFRGAYSAGTAYAPGDVVTYDRSAWVCLVASTGNTPPALPTTSNTYWRCLAERGSDGAATGAIPKDVVVTAVSPGQTSFAISGGYTPSASKLITLNGTLLQPTDFDATDGSNVVLSVGANVGDELRLMEFATFAVGTVVNQSRIITAGSGLTGGGDLSADRSFAVDTAFFDALYAALGHSHSNATTSSAGFMSGADKTKLSALPDNTTLQAALALLAPLTSPTLLGTPTAPTPAPGDNTTKLATTAFVAAAIAALINAAPGALDTLDELAAALGDDANFAATITTALAGKQPLATLLTAIAGLSIVSGDLIYGSGVNAVSRLAKGTDGQVLALAAGVPSWASAAARAAADLAIVAGDIVYGSGANTLARLAKGTDGQILTLAAGLPSWAAAPATGVATDNGALEVGSYAFLRKTSGGTVNSGSTTNGSNLSPSYYKNSGAAWTNSGSASGSWRNVSGVKIDQSDIGLFQRIS